MTLNSLIFLPLRDGVRALSPWIWVGLCLFWPTEYGGREAMWLLRLVLKSQKATSYFFCHLSRHSFLLHFLSDSNCHAGRSLNHLERPRAVFLVPTEPSLRLIQPNYRMCEWRRLQMVQTEPLVSLLVEASLHGIDTSHQHCALSKYSVIYVNMDEPWELMLREIHQALKDKHDST